MPHVNSGLPVILSVEDDQEMQECYFDLLQDTGWVLSAFTVEEGLRFFSEHPDISVVVMDGDVPHLGMTTVELTKEIRKRGFSGPMIASSNNLEYRLALTDAGCDYTTAKIHVPDLVKRLLRNA